LPLQAKQKLIQKQAIFKWKPQGGLLRMTGKNLAGEGDLVFMDFNTLRVQAHPWSEFPIGVK
jgi:hypothetical protein